MSDDFPALMVEGPKLAASPVRLTRDRLPAGEVLVAVRWSSVNYKDGLAVTGSAPVVRAFPMVPGIDLAGVVVASTQADFVVGDEVIATGCGLGETHWGGYAGFARLPGAWLVRLPAGMTLQRAMAFGTAGLTAMLCVMAIERHGLPNASSVAVTGAAGGVGSVAVAVLSRLGHHVTAISGRPSETEYLRGLGAIDVLPRESLTERADKSLLAERWAGAVDTVGGAMLAGLLRCIAQSGGVAACGMVAGGDLPATVYPFILRGIGLLGITSTSTSMALKRLAWTRLSELVPHATIDGLTRTIELAQVPEVAREILAGRVRGRVAVRVS